MSEWIPTKERLPEEEDDYLVTYMWKDEVFDEEFISVGVLQYDKLATEYNWHSIYGIENYHTEEVIAWMPLPKPYEEDTDNE